MNKISKLITGLLLSFAAVGVSAGTLTLNFSEYYSYDEIDGQKNIILTYDLNALSGMDSFQSVEIDGIGWEFTIETVGDSFLSEASIDLGDGLFQITPGEGDDFSGTGSYSSGGMINLVDAGIGNIKIHNGYLNVQFFELFDNDLLELDAIVGGTLTLSTVMSSPVPVPGAVWLMISGLLSAGLIGRKRV